MSSDSVPEEIIQVAVTRHDVNLTFEDILVPLMRTADEVNRKRPDAAKDPRLAESLSKLSELAGQLHEVINQINQIDATLLASAGGDQVPRA